MQAVVENSEAYLSKHQRENSDSDGSHMSVDSEAPPPAPLKHSDSLLLLTQVLYAEEIGCPFARFVNTSSSAGAGTEKMQPWIFR